MAWAEQRARWGCEAGLSIVSGVLEKPAELLGRMSTGCRVLRIAAWIQRH